MTYTVFGENIDVNFTKKEWEKLIEIKGREKRSVRERLPLKTSEHYKKWLSQYRELVFEVLYDEV